MNCSPPKEPEQTVSESVATGYGAVIYTCRMGEWEERVFISNTELRCARVNPAPYHVSKSFQRLRLFHALVREDRDF